MSEIKCSNENPTKLEKYLFKMYGLYPIYKHDDSRTYAPIHVDHDDTYPLSVEIDDCVCYQFRGSLVKFLL